MAQVWLADWECHPRREADDLPDVCLVCGDEATDTVHRTFRWHPSWVWVFIFLGLVPVLIAVLLTTKTMAAGCPVCDRHRGHWWKGNLLAALMVVGGIAFLIGGISTAAALERPGRPMSGWLVLAAFGGLLVGLIAGVWTSNRLVRAAEMTTHDVRLTNVSEEFVAAVKDKRRSTRRERRDD